MHLRSCIEIIFASAVSLYKSWHHNIWPQDAATAAGFVRIFTHFVRPVGQFLLFPLPKLFLSCNRPSYSYSDQTFQSLTLKEHHQGAAKLRFAEASTFHSTVSQSITQPIRWSLDTLAACFTSGSYSQTLSPSSMKNVSLREVRLSL